MTDRITVKMGGHRRVIPPSRLSKFERLGYEVVEEEKEEENPLEEMTMDELYSLAQEKGIEGRSEMNKEELVNALEEVI